MEKLQPEAKPRCQSGFDVKFWLVARKEANLAPETNLSIAPTCYNHHNAMVYAYMGLRRLDSRDQSPARFKPPDMYDYDSHRYVLR